jgi:hypothetical protein
MKFQALKFQISISFQHTAGVITSCPYSSGPVCVCSWAKIGVNYSEQLESVPLPRKREQPNLDRVTASRPARLDSTRLGPMPARPARARAPKQIFDNGSSEEACSDKTRRRRRH